MSIVSPAEDAFGRALLDQLNGQPPQPLLLETDAGVSHPAMPASWFFQNSEDWHEWERKALTSVQGPALDLGAGAGRAALFLQNRGCPVTAIDNSPGAIEVCQRRGVLDARLHDFNQALPSDQRWGVVLLLCGNLGLAGSWEATRQMVTSLHSLCAEDAVIIADTVDPTVMVDQDVKDYQYKMVAQGEYVGNVTLRLSYGDVIGPWWPLTNVLIADVPRLVEGTGWFLEEHVIGGMDHYLKLRRTSGE